MFVVKCLPSSKKHPSGFMILHVTAPLKRLDVHLSKQHRCSEEKQENPSPGHCDAPFQRHLAPAAVGNQQKIWWLAP